ncbi:CBS domain-containing protein [Enterocloster bolteae]|uniref:CBS domain-containing protein n=1 Tax=Enterocloster bolteae TaxID=208479 RepID=UPI002A804EA8|nr:CBS domain-containing protein [Enterocloster bolteae]
MWILEALQKIDQNKKGFLIVTDSNGAVLGTLTDGDIRRALIKGFSVDDSIASIYTKTFKYLTLKDGIPGATELFKSESIKFLPVLDDEKKLLNVITKSQMLALLLQDIHAE